MAKGKVTIHEDGLHRSGYHPSDDEPIFENDGPSEMDTNESLTIWKSFAAVCKDTYGETFYDPPIVTTKDGVTKSKSYWRGWHRGDSRDTERELAARIVAGECRASGMNPDNERKWIKSVIFRTFEPAVEIDSAVSVTGQRVEGIRIHLRTGPSAMNEILDENVRRVKSGEAAPNVQTEAKRLEEWAYKSAELVGRSIPDWDSIRTRLHIQKRAAGGTVTIPRTGA